jgi:hypothetical protein
MPEATIDTAGACRTPYRRELATFGQETLRLGLPRENSKINCLLHVRDVAYLPKRVSRRLKVN